MSLCWIWEREARKLKMMSCGSEPDGGFGALRAAYLGYTGGSPVLREVSTSRMKVAQKSLLKSSSSAGNGAF